MNNFGIFFSKGTAVIRLPVNPEKLPVESQCENGDYNVLGIGPVMVPRMPGLKEVTISSYFPGRVSPGVLTPNEFKPPEFYIDFFRSAMNDKAPVRYTVARYYEDGTPFMAEDTGFQVLVTGFKTEERGGETGDFYYDLSLTEYRDYSPLTVQVKPRTGSQPPAATTQPVRQTPPGQLTVGCTAIANGNWYYSSYGDEPHGGGKGRQVKVSRIVDGSRRCPVHVVSMSGGALGWMEKSSLQVVSGG